MNLDTLRRGNEGRVISVGPSTATVRLEPSEASGSIAIVEWNFQPNAPAPPKHIHRSASETFFVIEGQIDFVLEDGPVRGTPGTSIHVAPGMAHTLANPNPEPARLLEIFCPGALLELIEGVGTILSAGGPPDIAELARLFELHDSELLRP